MKVEIENIESGCSFEEMVHGVLYVNQNPTLAEVGPCFKSLLRDTGKWAVVYLDGSIWSHVPPGTTFIPIEKGRRVILTQVIQE